ncbi:hypothetical protein LINPERPRIM_LOCUS4628, partial [Linum perenne]
GGCNAPLTVHLLLKYQPKTLFGIPTAPNKKQSALKKYTKTIEDDFSIDATNVDPCIKASFEMGIYYIPPPNCRPVLDLNCASDLLGLRSTLRRCKRRRGGG